MPLSHVSFSHSLAKILKWLPSTFRIKLGFLILVYKALSDMTCNLALQLSLTLTPVTPLLTSYSSEA